MVSLKHGLPVLMLLAASATATAQSAPPMSAAAGGSPAMEAVPTPLPPPETPSFASAPLAPTAFIERSDVVAVRREIAALRMACAAMPPHTVIETYPPTLPGNRIPPPPITARPYAAEEDTCAAVLNPDLAGPGYAIQLGMIGAGLTLFALLFFTLIGGVLRVLWHGPIARAFPALFARRFHG